MKNPYDGLEPKHYWKTGVSELHPMDIRGIWNPKFKFRPDDKFSTYGSCFAQHIGRSLSERGYNWLRTEVAPTGLRPENVAKFGYDIFSSRTGNIYTASLLRQWIEWCLEPHSVPGELWENAGRYYDPFRPRIEPDGFCSKEELLQSRALTLHSLRKSIQLCDYFVFTLGLTESWKNAAGYEYPLCPGTASGVYVPGEHLFENQNYDSIKKEINTTLQLLKDVNPRIKIILTVSPVPLTATYSGMHVLTATMHSKSILRAVAGFFCENRSFVDYFPSYEIISSPVFQGYFFENNNRTVSSHGVNFVMGSFFNDMQTKFPNMKQSIIPLSKIDTHKDYCDEEILNSFA